jgi:hypothetical protein
MVSTTPHRSEKGSKRSGQKSNIGVGFRPTDSSLTTKLSLLTKTNTKMQQLETTDKRRSGGRPFKFAEPSRAITLTLPESTLRDLQQVDPDRGRAIVKLAKEASWGPDERFLVQIVEIGENTGLLVLGPTQALRKIPFLQLVEVAPARYLLALSPGTDFQSLEIAVSDLLDDIGDDEPHEREVLTQLLHHLRNFRKAEGVSMAQILLVRLDSR